MHDYFKEHMRLIQYPSFEMKTLFEREAELFAEYIAPRIEPRYQGHSSDANILEIGCGTGRAITQIIESIYKKYSFGTNSPWWGAAHFFGVDMDPRMIAVARETESRKGHFHDNKIIHQDIFNYKNNNFFDVIYSAFNTIGVMEESDQPRLIAKKAELAKQGAYILTTTWSQSDATTEFLKRHYDSLGGLEVDVHKDKTFTKQGISYRISIDRLAEWYEQNNIQFIECKNVAKHWNIVVGRKL